MELKQERELELELLPMQRLPCPTMATVLCGMMSLTAQH